MVLANPNTENYDQNLMNFFQDSKLDTLPGDENIADAVSKVVDSYVCWVCKNPQNVRRYVYFDTTVITAIFAIKHSPDKVKSVFCHKHSI